MITTLFLRNVRKNLLCFIGLSVFTAISLAQTVTPWITSGDQSKLLQQQSTVSFAANSGTNASTVTIDANTTYQTMDGFGFCLTEGSAEVISGLASTQQDAVLNELFNPSSGIGVSIIRISIGASDLSSSDYSYNETAGDVNMTNFSLAGPDLTYLIPVLKKALAINPNIKVLATPWTAPRWMKTNNGWVGGSLQTQYYAAYANYFVKYFAAMKAQGINIWAITPQNEPENGGNDPSMTMNSTEEKNFINNNLGPAMASAGYSSIKIIAFDHNCDNTAYPIDVCNNSTYVDGAAFHLYAGNINNMSVVKNATNKNVYFTEQFTGSGGSFSGDFGWHMQNVVTGSINNWSKCVLEWNVANNTSMGPRTPGGCNSCLGAYTINNSTSYTRNVSYYIIGQVSKFVKAGAFRINSSTSNSALSVSAFKNPDGSIVTLVYNSGSSNTIKVVSGSQAFNYTIPAASAATFVWSGSTTNIPVTGVAVSPTSASVSVSGTVQLTATVSPSNATNKSVNWISSNSATASVNSSGLVTGVGAGTTTITVTTVDGNKTATSIITVTALDNSPYSGSAIALPGTVEAENFDKGGENIAYHDAETANQGGQYRTSEGVDIETCGEGGYNIGWTNAGEWMEYTVNVGTAGTYSMDARVASTSATGVFHIEFNGTNKTGSVSVPNTNGWQTWQSVTKTGISLSAGQQIMRIYIDAAGFNLNKVSFTSSSNVAVTGVSVSPTSASLTVGSTQQLTATVSPSNATNKNVSWNSSNTSVATVSSSGLVTAIAAGTATITVTTADANKTATCTITVTAPTSTFPGYYNIISSSSNKGLDVRDNSTASGAYIQQYTISNGGGNNQRWRLDDAGSGYYYIKVKSTQMCLATLNAGTGDGVQVIQATCNSSNSQKWALTNLGSGIYQITNVNGGKALDVKDNSTADGGLIQTWTYGGGANQKWQFVQVEATKRALVPTNVSNEKEREIKIYPNPFTNLVEISANLSAYKLVEVYNLAGKLVVRKTINDENEIKLDLSSLNSGIYFLKLKGEENYIQKIVKQ